MNALYLDPGFGEARRRELLYDGQIFILSPTPSSKALCEFAEEMSRKAFGGLDPVRAHEHMPVEKYVEILAVLKPRFIHAPESKRCIQGILTETGCDPAQTHFDVPRLRTASPFEYLRSGIAYAFQPHRDTWYSAPVSQLNWWMPVLEMQAGNAMAFHPRYWSRPLANSSRIYNYQTWNANYRLAATTQVKTDTRPQPHAEEPVEMEPQLRLVIPAGSMIIFSGAQLHSTVPNQTRDTRFSIDFRTVNAEDAFAGRGAPNIDSQSTGTPLGDYLRATDLAQFPPELIARYDGPNLRTKTAEAPSLTSEPSVAEMPLGSKIKSAVGDAQ